MAGLEFEYSDVLGELEALQGLVAEFLEPEGVSALELIGRKLRQVSTTDTTAVIPWETPDWLPIKTKTSDGDYQPDGRGGRLLRGIIKFKWEIRNTGPKPNKRTAYRFFELRGIASTVVEIEETGKGADDRLVTSWRQEVGDENSPGCHFHVQFDPVEGFGDVDVPRLPGILFTPMDAVEFVLGELFQDEWRRRAQHRRASADMWRPLQTKRLTRLLKWKLGLLQDNVAGSPWAALKTSKPPSDLFTRD